MNILIGSDQGWRQWLRRRMGDNELKVKKVEVGGFHASGTRAVPRGCQYLRTTRRISGFLLVPQETFHITPNLEIEMAIINNLIIIEIYMK